MSYHAVGIGNVSYLDVLLVFLALRLSLRAAFNFLQVLLSVSGLILVFLLFVSGLMYCPEGFIEYLSQIFLCFVVVPFVVSDRFFLSRWDVLAKGFLIGVIVEGGFWILRMIQFGSLTGDALKEVSEFGLRFFLEPFTPNELGYLILMGFILSLSQRKLRYKYSLNLLYILSLFSLSKTVYVVQALVLTRRHFKLVLFLFLVVGLNIKNDFARFEDPIRNEMYHKFFEYTTNGSFLFPLYRDESNLTLQPDVQSVHNSYAGFLVNNGLIVSVIISVVYIAGMWIGFSGKRINFKRLLWWIILLGITGMFNPFLLHSQIYFIVFFSLIFSIRNENSPIHYK